MKKTILLVVKYLLLLFIILLVSIIYRFGGKLFVKNENRIIVTQVSPTIEPSQILISTPKPSIYSDKQMGYITDVYEIGGKRYLKIDYVQWLSHSNTTCWIQKEIKGIPMCNPNGYLIVNDNPLIRTFEITPDAELSIIDMTIPDGYRIVDFNEFKSLYDSYNSLFMIYLQKNKVVKIESWYTP